MMDERAVQAGKAIADTLLEQKKVKASKEMIDAYFDEVHSYFPDGFEDQLIELDLIRHAVAYSAVAYMRDGSARLCADKIMEKLGVETK